MNVKLLPTVFVPVQGSKIPAKVEDNNSVCGFRLLDEGLLDEVQVPKPDFLRLIAADKLTALREIMKLFNSAPAKTMFEKAIFDRGCIEFGDQVVDLSSFAEEDDANEEG